MAAVSISQVQSPNVLKNQLAATTAGNGAALVNFKLDVTGATVRTLLSLAGDSVNALQFMSESDKTDILDETLNNDVTTKLQAALDSGYKHIIIPNGAYKVTSKLTVPADVFLHGYNTTIDSSTAHFEVIEFTSGGGMRGINLNGAGDTSLTVGSIGIKCYGTNNNPSAPTYVTGPIIDGCKIENFGEYGVKFEYVKTAIVSNCIIDEIGYAGIGGVSCEDIIVDGNIISDITQGSSTDGYGIFIDRKNGVSETENPRSYRCVITNNIVKNVDTGGNGQGIDTHAGIDFVIDGNVVQGCDSGIRLAASKIGATTEELGCVRCVVSNNVVQRSLTGGGENIAIGVSGAIDGSTVNEYAIDNVVSGNTLVGYGNAGTASTGAVKIQATKNTIISGNVIRASSVNCLYLNLENKNLNVHGNTLIDPWDDTATAPSCIRVGGNNNTGIIKNNLFVYEDSSLGTYVAVNALRTDSSLTGLDLDISECGFIGIDASHLNNALSTTTGINTLGMFKESGTFAISVSNSAAEFSQAVSFNKRFPYTPDVQLTLRHTFSVGGDNPIIGIGNGTLSQTGFTVYAKTADNGNWGGSGTINGYWMAM